MIDVSPLALRVTMRNIRVYSKSWISSVMPNLVEPIFYLLAMGVGLGGFIATSGSWHEDVPYITFIGTGLIAQAALFSPTFELIYGGYTRLAHQKTYDAILATPCSVADLTIGEIVWGALRSAWYGMLIVVVITAFGLVRSWWALALPIPLFIAGIFFSAVALCFVATANSYDYFNFYLSLILFPMFLFSGIFFPLHSLPPWAANLAWWLPLTHLVEVCRGLALGHVTPALLPHVLWFIIAGVPVVWLSVYLMRRRLVT